MKSRGFTLIEMSVVMAVLAMLLFAAVPSISTALDNTRIRNATESLQNGLQLARGEAVRRNQNVSFWLVTTNTPSALDNSCTLSNASGSWVVSVNSPEGHCADAPSTTNSPMIVTGRPTGDSGGNVAVTALQSDGATAASKVTFNGFGRITNADAISQVNITGTKSDATYRNLRVSISSAGLVRMCDPRVSNTGDPRKC